jgi:hypothetical protein
MAKVKKSDDLTTVQMALVGYEVEKQRLEQKIREIHSLLGGKRIKIGSSNGTAGPRTRHQMSAAARKRIAAAQRKRWQEYRKQKALAS